MENIPFLWLARWAMALLVAYLLVRKIRNLLLKVVLRFMPDRHRFSAHSFDKGAKLVNLIGMVLITILATALNLSVKRGTAWAKATLMPAPKIEYETPLPTPLPEYETPVLLPKVVPPKELRKVPTLTTHTVELNAIPLPVPQPSERSEPCFIQLHSFADIRNAQRQKDRMWPQKTCIGMMENERTPFKLLLGPFPNRTAAERTRKTQKLKGFTRPLTDIAFYIE